MVDSIWGGHRADIDGLTIYRMIPNRYTQAVGSFVFLDHIAPKIHEPNQPKESSTGPHPHRGIATLTYLLKGEDEHFDSRGNRNTVYSGGVQWMKAGNGIVHDEILTIDTHTQDPETHGFQFWINLPAKNKAEEPAYHSLLAEEIPTLELSNNTGELKIILGRWNEQLFSPIPTYHQEFLWHLTLKANETFIHEFENEQEMALMFPNNGGSVSGVAVSKGDFVSLDQTSKFISIQNTNDELLDVLIFGGPRYEEPIYAEGPFVMNSRLEIAHAYRDYFDGKYGTIDFDTK